MPRLRTLLLVALALALLAPAGAAASSRQLSVMQDDARILHGTPQTRDETLNEMDALGTDVVKVQLTWRDVAPASRPVDPTNPGVYGWGLVDAAVAGIRARGMRPYLTIGGRAPNYAVGRQTARFNGTYRPSAPEFELFARAAGRRYAGLVDIWSIWNEPGLTTWIQPQRDRRRRPLSPQIYRGLYLAGHRGPVGHRPRRRHDPHRRAGPHRLTELQQGRTGGVHPRDGLPRPPLPAAARQRPHGASLPGLVPAHPHLGARLPPLHLAPRAALDSHCPRRRSHRRALAGDPGAGPRGPSRPPVARPARMDHRVRLPDQPARPVPDPDRPRAGLHGLQRVPGVPQRPRELVRPVHAVRHRAERVGCRAVLGLPAGPAVRGRRAQGGRLRRVAAAAVRTGSPRTARRLRRPALRRPWNFVLLCRCAAAGPTARSAPPG